MSSSTNNQFLISVVVTTYNREVLLSETLRSILSQTYLNTEIIVVDNYSDYDFFGLISSFNDKRLFPYQNANNGIIAVNRNFGINMAKGDFIAFCDDDDIWLPEKLERQLNLIIEKKVDLVYTRRINFNNYGILSYTKHYQIKSLFLFLMRNPITTSSVLVRKCDYLKFDEDKNLISVEDYYLWLTLFNKGLVMKLLPEYLVKYRITNSSVSSTNKYQSYLKYYYAILKFLIENKIQKKYIIFLFLKGSLRACLKF